MALDNFIPKNAVKLCNKCKKQNRERPFTCEVYPRWIPDEALTGDCPDFELDEQRVKEREEWLRNFEKEMAEKAAQHKKRQKEEE